MGGFSQRERIIESLVKPACQALGFLHGKFLERALVECVVLCFVGIGFV